MRQQGGSKGGSICDVLPGCSFILIASRTTAGCGNLAFVNLKTNQERIGVKMKKLITVVLSLLFAVCMSYTAVAGSLDSPGAPSAGSGMYTLQNLYDYLTIGTALTVQTGFQEPTSGPGSTMKTTKEIGDDIKALFDLCPVSSADVKSGVRFFSTQAGSWGVRTGTAQLVPTPTTTPTVTPTPTPTSSLYGNLVAYWALNETSGTTCADSAGSNNGTITGATINQTGKLGKSYSFDENGDYVTLANESNFDFVTDPNSSVSISCWFKKTDSENAQHTIFAKYQENDVATRKGFWWDLDAGRPCLRLYSSGANWATVMSSDIDSYSLNDGNWHLLVFVKTGTSFTDVNNYKVYVDGVSHSLNFASGGTLGDMSNNYSAGIGTTNDHNSYYLGYLDEIGVWNKGLSPSEVSELWNNGNGRAL